MLFLFFKSVDFQGSYAFLKVLHTFAINSKIIFFLMYVTRGGGGGGPGGAGPTLSKKKEL